MAEFGNSYAAGRRRRDSAAADSAGPDSRFAAEDRKRRLANVASPTSPAPNNASKPLSGTTSLDSTASVEPACASIESVGNDGLARPASDSPAIKSSGTVSR